MIEIKKGISVIELIVIIFAIIGFAIMGFVSIRNYQKKNSDQAKIEVVKIIRSALYEYFQVEKKMPKNPQVGQLDCGANSFFLKELIEKGYLSAVDIKSGETWDYCFYDYGANNSLGAIVGIKMDLLQIKNQCQLTPSDKPFWCDESYYCLHIPYQVKND